MFEPEVFRKHMYGIEDSICDIVGTFRRPPQLFGAPRSELAPDELCPPSLRPWLGYTKLVCILKSLFLMRDDSLERKAAVKIGT